MNFNEPSDQVIFEDKENQISEFKITCCFVGKKCCKKYKKSKRCKKCPSA